MNSNVLISLSILQKNIIKGLWRNSAIVPRWPRGDFGFKSRQVHFFSSGFEHTFTSFMCPSASPRGIPTSPVVFFGLTFLLQFKRKVRGVILQIQGPLGHLVPSEHKWFNSLQQFYYLEAIFRIFKGLQLSWLECLGRGPQGYRIGTFGSSLRFELKWFDSIFSVLL